MTKTSTIASQLFICEMKHFVIPWNPQPGELKHITQMFTAQHQLSNLPDAQKTIHSLTGCNDLILLVALIIKFIATLK